MQQRYVLVNRNDDSSFLPSSRAAFIKEFGVRLLDYLVPWYRLLTRMS